MQTKRFEPERAKEIPAAVREAFAEGGTSSKNNFQLLCRRCNMRKSDKI